VFIIIPPDETAAAGNTERIPTDLILGGVNMYAILHRKCMSTCYNNIQTSRRNVVLLKCIMYNISTRLKMGVLNYGVKDTIRIILL